MAKMKRKRDVSVESSRLLACLIVVGCHTTLSVLYNDTYQPGRVFLACLFADGVGIFWMITGCFFFSQKYSKVLRHGLTRILIPLILISLAGYAVSCLPLEGFVRPGMDYIRDALLHWRNAIPGMEHLWYLYVNLLVILCYPLLNGLVRLIDRKPLYQGLFLVLTLAAFGLNDLTSNTLFGFSHDHFYAAVPAGILMIWGHILYQYRSLFSSRKLSVVFFGLFLGFNVLRMLLQMHRYGINPADNSILYWYSSLGTLAAACLILGCLAWFHPDRLQSSKVSSEAQTLLTTLASYSFLIYLVHFPILRILNAFKIPNLLSDPLFAGGTSFGKELLYQAIMILVLFLVSLFVSWLIRLFWRGIRRLFRPVQTDNQTS